MLNILPVSAPVRLISAPAYDIGFGAQRKLLLKHITQSKYQHNDKMHVVFLNQINKGMTVNLLGKYRKTLFNYLISSPLWHILSRTGLMFHLRLKV